MELKDLDILDVLNIVISSLVTYIASLIIRLPIYWEMLIWIGLFYYLFKFNSFALEILVRRYERNQLTNELMEMDPDSLLTSFKHMTDREIGMVKLSKIRSKYDDDYLLRLYDETTSGHIQFYVIRHIRDEDALCKLDLPLSGNDDSEYELKWYGIGRLYDPKCLQSIVTHSSNRELIQYARDRIYSKRILAELRMSLNDRYQQLITQRISVLRDEGFIV